MNLKQEIAKNGFKKVYIICGAEEYIRQKAVKELLESFAFNMPELNHSVFEGKVKVSDLIAACETLPLMDEKRLVQVKNFEPLSAGKGDGEKSKQDVSKLEEYLPKLPDFTVLFFDSEGKVDKRRKLYKAVEKNGLVQEYVKPKPGDMIRMIQEEAKNRGLSMTGEVAAELMQHSGQEMFALAGELDKFASFKTDGKVTKEDIARYASKSLEYDAFLLHGLFMQGKAGEGLALLNTIVEAEKSAFGVIGLIAYKFRAMLKVRAMMDAKFSMRDIQSNFGGNPFAVKEAVADCQKFTAAELRTALKALSDLDYGLKSGQGGRFLMETVFLKIYKVQ